MSRARKVSETGFSLVETVAAMGILALAAIPLMQITGDATRNAASLENRLLARTVAENVMARTMAVPEPLEAGIRSGQEIQMGRVYDWSLITGPAEPGQLQTMEVTVRREETEQNLARLVSLKFVPKALPDTGQAPTQPEGEG